jgi:uncharacterized membrane protein
MVRHYSRDETVQGYTRKIVYVSIYEAIAIAICSVSFAAISGSSLGSATVLSIAASAIAVTWNYVFTSAFEAWESRQVVRGRSIKRRISHAVGFEGGLLLIFVPLMAWWLKVSLMQALAMNIGLAAFFLCYTFVFSWTFDRIFGLPASARA